MGIKTIDIKYQPDDGKRSEFDLITILLIFFAIGIIVGAILFIFYFRESRVAQLLDDKATLSVIVVENDGSETQNVFLGFYNSGTRNAAFIAIPDVARLRVDYEDKTSYDIVRGIYFKGGITVLRKTLEKLTGERFEYYVVYDVKDAERLVDLLDGIEVDNPLSLNYTEVEKDIFIKVRKGFDHLDGAKVKQLLLYGYGPSPQQAVVDIRRSLVESMLRRSKDMETLLGNGKVSDRVFRTIKTSFSRKDIKVLTAEIGRIDSSRLLFYRMLGKNVSVKEGVYLSPIENGKWLRDKIEAVKKHLNNEGPVPMGDEVNIEILNGSNNPGQALSLRNHLLEYGFNVVHYGNALRNDYEKSQVIDRVGQLALARKVADLINCNEVSSKIDNTLMVDVSIIIGNDFEGQYVR